MTLITYSVGGGGGGGGGVGKSATPCRQVSEI